MDKRSLLGYVHKFIRVGRTELSDSYLKAKKKDLYFMWEMPVDQPCIQFSQNLFFLTTMTLCILTVDEIMQLNIVMENALKMESEETVCL